MPEITVTDIKAFDLPDADKGKRSGTSDPYIILKVQLPDGQIVSKARTSTTKNARDAEWADEDLSLVVPKDFNNGTLCVVVLDDDVSSDDDVLGTLDCQKTFESDVEGIELRAGDAAVLARAVHRPRPVPENEKRMAFVLFFSELNPTS